MLHLVEPEQKTLLVALYQSIYDRLMNQRLSGTFASDIGYSLAVAVVVVLPMILIFALSSKYFIKGVFAGGCKE
jgi:ABC-type glycerol-3-phosphate transport system permease component